MNASKPVDWDELYPGRFLKPFHIADKPTLTISAVDVEELVGDKGPQTKGILMFAEQGFKALPMNKTNGICIREMFGRRLADWVGKRVVFYQAEFNGEPCIRVWGSPDIAKDTDIIVQLPRKKPFAMKMHCTAKKAAQSEAVAKYIDQMKRSTTPEMLDDVLTAFGEDQSITDAEAKYLDTAITKRRGQINAPA
jgi:hypothetical protein